MTIPWSSTVNVTFGSGSNNPGPPLNTGFSDFTYSPNLGIPYGSYTVINSSHDAGHLYFGPFVWGTTSGYKMIAGYNASSTPKVVFGDTVRGLCSNSKYLFWSQIDKVNGCFSPSFTFSVETLSGAVISSFQTGEVGGSLSQDNYSWYYGYFDPTKPPPLPFYGFTFQLPAGINDIVVKIVTNPGNGSANCGTFFEVDNILLTPVGPDIRIFSPNSVGAWIAGSCFQGVPLVLSSRIDSGAYQFGTPNYILQGYSNPGFQWQQSLDQGFTWTDIPGETNATISHQFNIPDTFWVRLRVSEAADISNPGCSNVSNVMQIQVDGLPKEFSLTSNSPVCTDGDLVLSVSGGATYNTFGPNGYFDDSPFPHIYHPALADSGWYYSEIFSFGGCKGVDSEYVRVVGPDLHVSNDRVICYGDTVRLHASGGTRYDWTPSSGLNNPKVPDPVASPEVTTTYQVQVTDNSGCSAYGNIVVTLRNSLLKAMFNGPEVVCPGEAIQFKDTSEGKIVSWMWNFGNGNTIDVMNPPAQHYPVLNGVFLPVRLTITDSSGCTQTIQKTIESVNNCFIAVPNAFTPNNDGLNDFLYPLNAYKATRLDFRVFNRMGQMVFRTNNWTHGWDGTMGGQPQATGVYVWMLTYTDASGKPVFLKGTAALIR